MPSLLQPLFLSLSTVLFLTLLILPSSPALSFLTSISYPFSSLFSRSSSLPSINMHPSNHPPPSPLNSLTLMTLNVRFDGQAYSNPIPIPWKGSIEIDPYPGRKRPKLKDGRNDTRYDRNDWSERPWVERRSRLVDMIASESSSSSSFSSSSSSFGSSLSAGPDIIAFQEVLHPQLLDLQQLLGETYDHRGVGRDDGREKGEYSPIFWKKGVLEEVGWGVRWLSEGGGVGSVGWDASQTRIATLLTLRPITPPHLPSQPSSPSSLIHIINTHYDDGGIKARGMSSLLLRREVRRWVESMEMGDSTDQQQHSKAKPKPNDQKGLVVLLGDFNSPEQESGYRNMISPFPLKQTFPNPLTPSFNFIDSLSRHEIAIRSPSSSLGGGTSSTGLRQTQAYGPRGTYTGFSQPGEEVDGRIDFVFLGLDEEMVEEKWKRWKRENPGKGLRLDEEDGGMELQDEEEEKRDDIGKREGDQWDKQSLRGRKSDRQRRDWWPFGSNDDDEGNKQDKGELDLSDVPVRGGWRVNRYTVRDNLIAGSGDVKGWTGRWSDHRAVVVEIGRG